jgi:hypothetical protein
VEVFSGENPSTISGENFLRHSSFISAKPITFAAASQ